MTKAAKVIFALLVVASFGAFFAAQRLKHTPPVIQQVKGNLTFSPNGDGWFDEMRFSFLIKKADDVTVEMVDARGDTVRTLVRNRPTRAYRKVPTIVWDGRTDDGRRAPDGKYRIKVSLRREGRSRFAPRMITLDTTPPKPTITAIGPNRDAGPELLPNKDGRARIRFPPAGPNAQLMIFKTAPGKPRLVTKYAVKQGAMVSGWSGTTKGRPVSAGTYVAVVRWRDKAGNLGASVPLDRVGVPKLPYGEALPGRGGITVRYLEIQPPRFPIKAGELTRIGVDARDRCYTWSIRRIGEPTPRNGPRRSCKAVLAVHAPRGVSGMYVFEARTARHVARAPLAVQGAEPAPVLVVLPLITWQGRNPVDDDGDGRANVLDAGLAVETERVFAQGKLPAGFERNEGPLFSYLARQGRRFDVTTDYALALGQGPKLEGHRGVVLPGDVRWLPRGSQQMLREYVRDGGRLLELGLDSLRRNATITPRGRVYKPTPQTEADLFGTRLRSIVRKPASLTGIDDKIQLFTGNVFGGTGTFTGFPGYEAVAALGGGVERVANAVLDDPNNPASVIVASKVGKGYVIRTGLVDFATRLGGDENTAQLLLRSWTILSQKAAP